MNRVHLIIFLSVFLAACVSTDTRERKPDKKFTVSIEPIDIEFEKAREIGLQYLSHVSWYDYDGKEIQVEKCDGGETSQCDYKVSHIGNGCGWGSFVKEQCNESVCIYSFTKYSEGSVVCE